MSESRATSSHLKVEPKSKLTKPLSDPATTKANFQPTTEGSRCDKN